MSLELEISLDKDIKELNAFMTNVKFKAVVKSARQALNRTAKQTQSSAIKEIRKRRKLKIRDLKGSKKNKTRGYVTTSKAKGNDLSMLESRVNFSGTSLPLILFILGKKTPKTQTLPNRRRRSRRFEINRGTKEKRKGLFVQRAKRGRRQYQVFRRVDSKDRSRGFKMQSAPSIAQLLRSKTDMLRRIESKALIDLQKNYSRVLAFNLSKVKL